MDSCQQATLLRGNPKLRPLKEIPHQDYSTGMWRMRRRWDYFASVPEDQSSFGNPRRKSKKRLGCSVSWVVVRRYETGIQETQQQRWFAIETPSPPPPPSSRLRTPPPSPNFSTSTEYIRPRLPRKIQTPRCKSSVRSPVCLSVCLSRPSSSHVRIDR
ncbi:hypothetical protein ACMFMF_003370 [Clarireedia jacksonii]